MASTRESVSKNALVTAREACGRFAEHQELIKKFLRSFEKRTETPDARFGHKKYKAMLRSAVNRHTDTIMIDLNDLNEFCLKEVQDPDMSIVQALSVNKLKLQESIGSLLTDIEGNALRYHKFFYEACTAEMPERDADFNTEKTEVVKDTIQLWRTRNLEAQAADGQLAGQAEIPIPLKLQNSWDVHFKPRAAGQVLKMREIKAHHVGSLVQLDCLVVRVSGVKPKIEVATYRCEQCGAEIFQSVEGERYTPPKECPSKKCKENRHLGKLTQNLRTSKLVRYQEMRVQEKSSDVPVGSVPRGMNVVLYGDLTRQVLPGEYIQVTGVYAPYELPWHVARNKGTQQEMYIEAHHIQKHKHGYSDQVKDEDMMNRKIDEAYKRGNLYENASKSIAPEIFGHLDIKKALLLALVGGMQKNMADGMKIRGDIHTLLMGDPGVAKSQLMKQAVNIAPRSVYTTGKGSSGVGLTAAVVRDNVTGEVTLEGGSLVLADMGICAIDEFDKMDESDRTAIHEVMEQQVVSIAKSGITTTLNSRTTVLAAANPAYGRYNPYKSPVENIGLPAALLSRFDLLFLLLDTVDAEKDNQLALHVAKVNAKSRADPTAAPANGEKESSAMDWGFSPFDSTFMRAYIRKARTFEPMVPESLFEDIVGAYVSIREDEKGDTKADKRKSYTTPRTLLALLRLSQALARVRFGQQVERQDFEEALRLMKCSKESVETSMPAAKHQHPLDVVHDIVAELSKSSKDPEGWVDVRNVVSMAGHKALSEEMVNQAFENWESLSIMLRNENKTLVKFMVPMS
eukprot:gnl/TRDRNA2_/TRDRNA2_179663_c0_seq1.p1 gnl/TRDRNA2_/TRDRNA2_179663_c0~~gnl/TRDRNA2_/TRDRNA2_179663_c0_seq1.p1  ORF type:complete len:819 (-),score=202.22 gnl/TRDRNA2_/TRDRNA2_179663_c0_seq1:246-2636(-)